MKFASTDNGGPDCIFVTNSSRPCSPFDAEQDESTRWQRKTCAWVGQQGNGANPGESWTEIQRRSSSGVFFRPCCMHTLLNKYSQAYAGTVSLYYKFGLEFFLSYFHFFRGDHERIIDWNHRSSYSHRQSFFTALLSGYPCRAFLPRFLSHLRHVAGSPCSTRAAATPESISTLDSDTGRFLNLKHTH
jgi:hypothetical protein